MVTGASVLFYCIPAPEAVYIYGGLKMKNYESFNKEELMAALLNYPRDAYELAHVLGGALENTRIYERICNRPEKVMAAKSKMGEIERKANQVVGIISRMQNTTGRKIISNYIKTSEEKVSFIYDLDDFFNELYVFQKEA